MHGSKKHTFITLSAMLIVATMSALMSCTTPEETGIVEEPPTVNEQQRPIGLSVGVSSRAVDLSTVYDNFCVRSVKTNADGTQSLVMPNYLVKNTDSRWTYGGETNIDGSIQYLKYWDLSASSYTFAAVAPASATGSTYSIDDNGQVTLTLADLSTDWMIARTIRRGVNDASELLDYDDIAEDIADIDLSAGKTSAVFPTPNSAYAEVPLNFHRILAKVIIKAYADDQTTLTPLEVGFNNIGIAPATYNTDTGWTTTPAAYHEIYNQNTQITAEHNSRETALQLTELYVIPQQQTDATNAPLVQITVKRDNDDDQVGTYRIPHLWQANYVYTYYLIFESGETGQVILFDVVVEPFGKGGEAEDKQTNW